jgi:RNA polymerase sigma-70 factor (ECF subfamily)
MDLPDGDSPRIEPKLDDALRHLSKRQRSVVFLVEGLGLTYQETADQLGISRSAVQTHLERALARLRNDLGVTLDV